MAKPVMRRKVVPAMVEQTKEWKFPGFTYAEVRRRPDRLEEGIRRMWSHPCTVEPFKGLGLTWGEVWKRALKLARRRERHG
jgi:hypothetical protein